MAVAPLLNPTAHNSKEYKMSSDNIDSWRLFYGNGTVYISQGDRVREFDEYNFDVESLRAKAWGEYWVTEDVIVALGSEVSKKKALKALRNVIKRIKFKMKKARRYR